MRLAFIGDRITDAEALVTARVRDGLRRRIGPGRRKLTELRKAGYGVALNCRRGDMSSGMVVATFASRPAAEVARSALAASGIPATIEADDTAGLGPDLSLSNGVRSSRRKTRTRRGAFWRRSGSSTASAARIAGYDARPGAVGSGRARCRHHPHIAGGRQLASATLGGWTSASGSLED